jgi:hypothetical protein
MAEKSVVGRYFEHLAEYQLAICKECRYGVWPAQVERHLHKHHKIPYKEAQLIGEGIRSWPGLIHYPSELILPEHVIPSIPQLPLYPDGLLCQIDPTRCRYIARSTESIRRHWREVHGWSAGKKQGRPSRTKKKSVQAQVQEGCKQVHCQRFFSSRHGSQFFETNPPVKGQQDAPRVIPVNGEAAWARVGDQMAKVWENIKKRAQNTIQDGQRDEVNPWLERTQWLPYLVGMERPDLLACIEEPMADPDPRKDNKAKPVEAAIWAAMDGLVRFSQASVIDRVGVFVRLEAIRTEKHQTRYQPLQPYMDKDAIVKHMRPYPRALNGML